MAQRSVLEKIAREMLTDQGIAAIWRLHLNAATLYRVGNAISAEVMLDIADLATEEWERREAAAQIS